MYFLLGDLPAEAVMHMNTMTLFHNIWSNSDLTVHKVVKHVLMMCRSSSVTWSNHVQQLCLKYGLPAPLALIQSPPWPKHSWSRLVKSRITNWYETHLREPSGSIWGTTPSSVQYLLQSGCKETENTPEIPDL